MGAIHLTKDEFLRKVADIDAGGEWKFLGDKPAVIDFYAPWCGPCKMLSPVIDEVANEYEGRVDIYKISVDDEQELASHFGVRAIPLEPTTYVSLNFVCLKERAASPEITLFKNHLIKACSRFV